LVGFNTNNTLALPNGGGAVTMSKHGSAGHNELFARLTPAALPAGEIFRLFLEPIVQGVNHFLRAAPRAADVSFIGLSGGGWTGHLLAAVDPRIRQSFPVAGAYPLYIRAVWPTPDDAEQKYPPLYRETDANGDGVLDTAGGGHVEVLLGAEKKGEGKTFGKLLGHDEVFLATSYNAGKLKKKAADLRRHAILDLELPAIAKIELIHADERLTLEKKAPEVTGQQGATPPSVWVVSSAPLKDPDQAKLDGIASALAALKAKDFVNDADAKKIKWDKAFQARVTTGDGRVFTVTVSDDKKDGDSYARCDAPAWRGQVFTLQAFQVNKFKKKLHELSK